jgi:DNA invertase Pin-like site-specific DNA recombinase
MSTEHQRYSTSNQMDVIKEYAVRKGMDIGKIYSDEGKSGLNIKGRDALGRMIHDVESGEADFTAILVYDVSRWGRFQDADESAYYEYICRRAGNSVHYCAEQFDNDGSPISAIVKSVKRTMAGEYSRELSSKVFQGACRLIHLGYKQGGAAGYGLRRMLVDSSGGHKGVLQIGEQKSIQTDRVILVPGPAEEVAIVRWMYKQFVEEGECESKIAAAANEKGIFTDFGRPWTRGTVHEVLTNEKYIGNNVYHRTSFKLKKKHVQNPSDKWVRAEGAFVGIVPQDLFSTAQEIILARSRKLSDDEMLGRLRDVLQKHGRISGILIDEEEDTPSSSAFRSRFGSLVTAYQLIGYDPEIDYGFMEINRRLRKQHPEIVAQTVENLRRIGAHVSEAGKLGVLRVNGELNVSIVLCRHQETSSGSSRWVIRLDEGLKPDITIAVRMTATNEGIRDYYILPGIDMTWEKLRIAEENGIYLDAYRADTLDGFLNMTRQTSIPQAA